MWKSRRAISKGCGKGWETSWFSSLSTPRHFHGLAFVSNHLFALAGCKLANNFCLASCIPRAASVSLSASALSLFGLVRGICG